METFERKQTRTVPH